jgi:hypothetical protein
MRDEEFKILQIVPAVVRAYACYKNDDDQLFAARVELWALVEYQDGKRAVRGMISDGDSSMETVEQVVNFEGFESTRWP